MQIPKPVAYRERLTAPVSYWVIGLFFGGSFITAVTFMLGPVAVLVGTVAVLALITWTLLAWGGLTLVVDDAGLRVGRHLLEWRYIGQVSAADPSVKRRVMARDDAFLALRPYVAGAVVVGVSDAADPHLCWLISSRDPDAVVAAMEERRSAVAGRASDQARLDSAG